MPILKRRFSFVWLFYFCETAGTQAQWNHSLVPWPLGNQSMWLKGRWADHPGSSRSAFQKQKQTQSCLKTSFRPTAPFPFPYDWRNGACGLLAVCVPVLSLESSTRHRILCAVCLCPLEAQRGSSAHPEFPPHPSISLGPLPLVVETHPVTTTALDASLQLRALQHTHRRGVTNPGYPPWQCATTCMILEHEESRGEYCWSLRALLLN